MSRTYRGKTGITLLTIAVVIAVSLAMFWPFRHSFFVFDDFAMIEHAIEGPAAVLKGYNNILRVAASAFIWPLYAFSGHDPTGYNLFSLSLYALNAVLFYFFASSLFADRRLASWGAIIFAATAVGCDAVFWKAAYSTLLNVTFYLLTLTAYLKFRSSGSGRYYWLSVALFLFAVLSKEESASLPLVVLAMERFVFGKKIDAELIRRILPYCLLILCYLLVNYILIYHVFQGESELVKHSSFRPLHTLLAPWTAFFISPHGYLKSGDARIYATAVLVPLSLVFVRDRRYLLFALAWILLTFLPQSLSNLSQFQPKYILNSVSRHLYLPSVGVSLCYALLLSRLRDFLPARIFLAATALVLTGYFAANHSIIAKRGNEWKDEGAPVEAFLREIKGKVPAFPPNTFITCVQPPIGRAYVQQSLRAFYKNPSITWIDNPRTFNPPPGASVFIIYCTWYSSSKVDVSVMRVL